MFGNIQKYLSQFRGLNRTGRLIFNVASLTINAYRYAGRKNQDDHQQ